ncbi:hypothetical protein [Hafnia paralvei]|uniref:hypothetical protein n=1 Tax=Hafnia paralvei TaxID=546367 RepID=UPI00300DA3EB
MNKQKINDIRYTTKQASRKIAVATKKAEEGNYEKASEYLRETANSLNTLADELEVSITEKNG